MKVLILCEHFAPETGAQALQATKVADALHDAGCEVRILCGVPASARKEMRYPVGRVVEQSKAMGRDLISRVYRRLRYEFTSVSANSDWVRRMATEAARIGEDFEPDIVLTQSTPFRVHLVGLHLPTSMKQGWVAYFSDLWPLSLTPVPYRTPLSVLLKPLHMHALKRVTSQARTLIFSNEVAARLTKDALASHLIPACTVASHIGMPPSDTTPSFELTQQYGTRFVHVGKLTRERASGALIDALNSIGKRWSYRGFTGVTFVGDVAPSFRRACSDLEHRGVVHFTGELPPDSAQAISRAAKALVVIEADMDESPFLASKFADYAMLKRPILAICPSGPMRDLLASHGGGIAVPHDSAEIISAIDTLLGDSFENGSESLAGEFVAERIASQYLDAFRGVL